MPRNKFSMIPPEAVCDYHVVPSLNELAGDDCHRGCGAAISLWRRHRALAAEPEGIVVATDDGVGGKMLALTVGDVAAGKKQRKWLLLTIWQ